MFIWKFMQQSIGVKECLANRGIPLETTCPLCHLEAESIMHALRDCSLVKPVWYQLGTHCLYSTFFSQDIREWITINCSLKSSQNVVGIPQNILFSLLSGWFGNSETKLSLLTGGQIRTQASLLLCKPWNSFCVLPNRGGKTRW